MGLLKRVLRHCVLQNISPQGNFIPYTDIDSQYSANPSIEALSLDVSDDENDDKSGMEKDDNEENDNDSDLDSFDQQLAEMEASLRGNKDKKSSSTRQKNKIDQINKKKKQSQ